MAVQRDSPRTHRQEAHQGLEQGAFAHAVFAEQRDDFARGHGEADTADDDRLTVAAGQVVSVGADPPFDHLVGDAVDGEICRTWEVLAGWIKSAVIQIEIHTVTLVRCVVTE